MKRWSVFLIVCAATLLDASGVVLAQSVADDAVAQAEGGLYVGPGAESVDRQAVQASVADAAEFSMSLLVVVLGDEADAVTVADQARDLRSGTVLVFTPTAYGASSSELTQDELNAALDDAGAELSGPEVARGVAAFVAAADRTGPNWLLSGFGIVVVLAVVAVAGRAWERRASSERRTAGLEKEWVALQSKADELADPVLELSTLVDLAEREDVSSRYRGAAAAYRDVRDRLDRAASADEIEALAGRLDEVEASLERVLEMVTGEPSQ